MGTMLPASCRLGGSVLESVEEDML